MDKPKRFDEYESCEDCKHWWNSQCDAPERTRIDCKTFLPTRNVLIPLQIKKLQKDVKQLSIASIISGIATILIGITTIMIKLGGK